MTVMDNSNSSDPDLLIASSRIAWPTEVLKDVSAAMRRDGFYQTAELVDDALLTLEIEVQNRLKNLQNTSKTNAPPALKVVK